MPREPRDVIGKGVHERNARDWFKVRKFAIRRLRERWMPAQVAAYLGVSKSFISKWWSVWRMNKTWDSLRDRSTRPKTIKTKKWECYDLVVETRKAHPEMGPQKIKAYLGERINISHQAIYEMLVAAEQIKPGPKVRRRWRSFARHHSNSMWQMDFKTLSEGGPYLVSIIDDHSRFILASRVVEAETAEIAISVFLRAIAMFGMPRQILTDHGVQFYAVRGGTSQFDAVCNDLGVHHIMAGVRRPTTIGKIERWHRTVKEELLLRCQSIDVFRIRLPEYLEWYNCSRPHWGIDLRTPLSIYHADFITPEDFAPDASVHEVP
jgi:transposase InsO family protein